ncbi:peptide-methionine (S)-S-oxide reductase MsrA [Hellea sp.]|nr:peptide-methionine (S)-S-oxide reductase MsrA [Hellea sp.]
MKHFIAITFAVALAACTSAQSAEPPTETASTTDVKLSGQTDTAIFAGGCFWCVESDFEKLPGVIDAVSGYTGGEIQNPTYRNHPGYREAAKIIYDPTIVSYDQLLDYYWHHIDPTDSRGQFCDKGHAYTPAIYARPDQIKMAEASEAEIKKTKPFADPIIVPVLPATKFWDAEDYHQEYYLKNPRRYEFYRKGCGRDARVKQLWGSK